MVALLEAGDARPHVDNHASAFVAQNGRERAFRIVARERKRIGMTNTGGMNLDEHLTLARTTHVDRFNTKRCARFPGYGCFGLHVQTP